MPTLIDEIAQLPGGTRWPWYSALVALAYRSLDGPLDADECLSAIRSKLRNVSHHDFGPTLMPTDPTDSAVADWFAEDGAQVHLIGALNGRKIANFFQAMSPECLALAMRLGSEKAPSLGYPPNVLPPVG